MRAIEPLTMSGVTPGVLPTGKPELTWISPRELLIDDTYQRGVGDKGARLIRKIVENFDSACRGYTFAGLPKNGPRP